MEAAATLLLRNSPATALLSAPSASRKPQLIFSTCNLRPVSSPTPLRKRLSSLKSRHTHRRRSLGFTGASVSSSVVTRFRITCGVSEISESQFPEVVLGSDRPVLVEFVANWCGPCRLVAPAIDAIAQEYGERLTVVKIDHDANPKLIEEYKVYGLPTLILFKDGKEVQESRREGAITKAKLKEYVDSLLNSPSVV
ncbi:hypothetical protein Dimus_010059 [Dionaea muscipula]